MVAKRNPASEGGVKSGRNLDRRTSTAPNRRRSGSVPQPMFRNGTEDEREHGPHPVELSIGDVRPEHVEDRSTEVLSRVVGVGRDALSQLERNVPSTLPHNPDGIRSGPLADEIGSSKKQWWTSLAGGMGQTEHTARGQRASVSPSAADISAGYRYRRDGPQADLRSRDISVRFRRCQTPSIARRAARHGAA